MKKYYDKTEYAPIIKNVKLDSVEIEVLDLTDFINAVNSPSKPQTEVPSVVGKTQAEAQAIIQKTQLKLPQNNIVPVSYTGDLAGTVSYQIPEAGTILNSGEEVFVMVTKQK